MVDDMPPLHLLEQALATMQVGVTISDANGRIVYVNPAEAQMHGYEPDELLGQPGSIFAPAGAGQGAGQGTGQGGPPRLDRVQSWKRETVNVRRDGSTFPVELLSDVVTDAEGRPVGLVTISQDITERKDQERRLRESEERFALAVQGSKDAIWDWDVVADELFCSPRWDEMLGRADDANPRFDSVDDWMERIHPADREGFADHLEAHLRGESDHFEEVHRLRCEDGSYMWALARGVAVRDETGRALRMSGSLSDVTSQYARDPLTGLPNRLLLEDRLTQALARTHRQPGIQVGVLFIDLDRFKLINDSLGHLQGDEMLIEVSRRLESALRAGETIGRQGGDEFVAVFEEIETEQEVLAAAARLHRALEAPFQVDGHELFVSASMGIALGRAEGSSLEDLLREADTAMYRAKLDGGGQSRVFDHGMRELVVEQLELGNQLRLALQREELKLCYQPIVRSTGREIVGVEALLRWHHPERGVLHPRLFLGLAEEVGLIVPIGRHVLRHACSEAAEWHRWLDGSRSFTLSVNVSPQELTRPDYADHLAEILEETGLPPETLWLEITEEVLLEDRGRTTATLERIRETGVRIALDDFGTGYSSLSYLDRLNVDSLKIDRSFVADMETVSTRRELIQTILNMASGLGIDVVAEGVETESQASRLESLQCSLLQGFALGRPADAEATYRLLAG